MLQKATSLVFSFACLGVGLFFSYQEEQILSNIWLAAGVVVSQMPWGGTK